MYQYDFSVRIDFFCLINSIRPSIKILKVDQPGIGGLIVKESEYLLKFGAGKLINFYIFYYNKILFKVILISHSC